MVLLPLDNSVAGSIVVAWKNVWSGILARIACDEEPYSQALGK